MSHTRFLLSAAAVVAASVVSVAHAQVISEPEPYLVDQFLPKSTALKRGYFFTEEQLKKLSPAARAELEKLLNAKADQATRMKIYQERVKEQYLTAQDALIQALAEQEALDKKDQQAYHYMIGVVVEPNEKDDDGGVIVSQVVEDSPAKQAGIAPGDIILSVKGTVKISQPQDLITAVEASEGKEIVLHVKTNGEEGTDRSLTITPVERPDNSEYDRQVEALLRDEWAQALKQYNRNDLKFRTIHPGIYWDHTALQQDLPENVSITISKSGKAPAKITVSRDEESWNMNETEVDQLPEDLRAPVRQLLTRPKVYTWIKTDENDPAVGGPTTTQLKQIRLQEQERQKLQQLQTVRDRQVQQLQQQLDALQKAVEKLQQNEPPE